MDDKIDIKLYSNDQLIEALSGVDDEKYFKNALEIYQALLLKNKWKYTEVTASTLGYDNNWYFELLWYLLARSPLAWCVFAEIDDENHKMDEKITRLNDYLAEHGINNHLKPDQNFHQT